MIITDLTTIDRLAEEAYANHPIFSVDLADYANLRHFADYLKAAKLETPALTKECFDRGKPRFVNRPYRFPDLSGIKSSIPDRRRNRWSGFGLFFFLLVQLSDHFRRNLLLR